MNKAVPIVVPAAETGQGGNFTQFLRGMWAALGSACAVTSGRAALDHVHSPEAVGHLSLRAKRMIRYGKISPW